MRPLLKSFAEVDPYTWVIFAEPVINTYIGVRLFIKLYAQTAPAGRVPVHKAVVIWLCNRIYIAEQYETQ